MWRRTGRDDRPTLGRLQVKVTLSPIILFLSMIGDGAHSARICFAIAAPHIPNNTTYQLDHVTQEMKANFAPRFKKRSTDCFIYITTCPCCSGHFLLRSTRHPTLKQRPQKTPRMVPSPLPQVPYPSTPHLSRSRPATSSRPWKRGWHIQLKEVDAITSSTEPATLNILIVAMEKSWSDAGLGQCCFLIVGWEQHQRQFAGDQGRDGPKLVMVMPTSPNLSL